MPETYALIESNGDVKRFLELSGNKPEFVIKPAAGSAGRGIVVVARHDGREFFTSSGQRYTRADLHYHIATVLSGLYSLQGQPDRAIVEQRIVCHEVFANVSEGGTPDIRVVLFRCVPVMAMVRLPTRGSRGRANLHQGAVGAGVDLHTGTTFGGVLQGPRDRRPSRHGQLDRGHQGAVLEGAASRRYEAGRRPGDGLRRRRFRRRCHPGAGRAGGQRPAGLEHPGRQPPRLAAAPGVCPLPAGGAAAWRPARRGDRNAGGDVEWPHVLEPSLSPVPSQRPGRGGHAWVFLQYLLGFRRLGWDVLFLDEIRPGMCRDDWDRPCGLRESKNLRDFTGLMRQFGLEGSYSLSYNGGEEVIGLPRHDVLDRLRRSALLINVMGYLRDEELLAAAPRRVFLDIDPGFGQMWHTLGLADIFAGHNDFVTIGENIGSPDCDIPTCGLRWLTTPQPVVLEQWPVKWTSRWRGRLACAGSRDGCTTKTALYQRRQLRGPFGPIDYRGKRYGLRVHEFRKFIGLPRRTGRSFRVALDIDPAETADLALLAENGWQLDDPRLAAGDAAAYRRDVQDSRAEFMVAKNLYVDTRGGWFSDRSICYLASGKPVIAQDTGLRHLYHSGSGLFLFSTLDEAAAAVAQIESDYPRHARAARDRRRAVRFGSRTERAARQAGHINAMKTIVVAGALANKPYNGGEAWVRLSWLLGLKKLGFDVWFIEQIAPRNCVDAAGAAVAFGDCVNRGYFQEVVAQFGLADCAALICGDGEQVHGEAFADLLVVCESAAALVNISGHLALQPLMDAFRTKVYIDIDPGFTQFWYAEGNRGARLAGHTDYFTIGENIGRPECPIPTGGIPWRPIRQPVVLDDWPVRWTSRGAGVSPASAAETATAPALAAGTAAPQGQPFTTVASCAAGLVR